MLDVPVYNMDGERTGAVQLDSRILGDRVRPQLLKQAIVAYQANRRQGSARTRNRSQVTGSTRKIHRQKGTGNARMGTVRTGIRRGGGVIFAKQDQAFSRALPKKMRRLARNNAILAKILSQDVLVIDGLAFEEPKTKRMVELLRGLGASAGCLLALHERDENIARSGRNLPRTDVCLVGDLNAYDILRRKKLILSRPAFEMLAGDPVTLRSQEWTGEV